MFRTNLAPLIRKRSLTGRCAGLLVTAALEHGLAHCPDCMRSPSRPRTHTARARVVCPTHACQRMRAPSEPSHTLASPALNSCPSVCRQHTGPGPCQCLRRGRCLLQPRRTVTRGLLRGRVPAVLRGQHRVFAHPQEAEEGDGAEDKQSAENCKRRLKLAWWEQRTQWHYRNWKQFKKAFVAYWVAEAHHRGNMAVDDQPANSARTRAAQVSQFHTILIYSDQKGMKILNKV